MLDGVLLVRKPDDFRLRLTLPFGVTVFDYLCRQSTVSQTYPLGARGPGLSENDTASFSREDLGQVFLRGALAYPGNCVAEAEPSAFVVVRCGEGGQMGRRILIEGATERIMEETSYQGGQARLILSFRDYRRIGSAEFPYHIVMSYPENGFHVVIDIERYEINPTLAPHLFDTTPS